jgi:HK97 family phage major capsid protein
MSETYLKQQVEARQSAWHEAKALLDTAAAEARDLTAEEREQWDRINADLDQRAAVIESVQEAEKREERIAKAAEGIERVVRDHKPASSDAEILRAMAKGEIRTHLFGPDAEQRDVYSTSTGAPVPTSFYNQVLMLARYTGPMLDPNVTTHLNTAGGESLQIPSLSTYSAGTAFAQGSAIGESDPVFNSFVTLSAYKYAFITQLSQELISDAGVDILGFLAEQTANGIGYSVGNKLTVGTGTVEPKGIVAAAGSGVTSATGTAGVFSAANIMDLVYSVDTAARQRPGAGFMANASSISKMRQLQSSGGYYIFSPAVSADQRDLILGYPMHENPHMASTGTGNKSVVFGDLKSYMVRIAGGGLQLDRSDEFAFNQGLVTFRAQIRVDGNLPQTSHVKYFQGAAS